MLNADRICLGTVQLGLPYGIANRGGQPDLPAAFSILDAAHQSGISLLDTSRAYGTSEEVIGSFAEKMGRSFQVISKLPPHPNCSRLSVSGFLKESLTRLRAPFLQGYLIHDFKTYRDHPEVWDFLLGLKNDHLVKQVGFSVYFPREVELFLAQGICPDIVQIPFSVLDTRFAPLLSELKQRSVEVHARSVFLQGAVFLPEEKLTGALQKAAASIRRLRELSSQTGVPVLDLCLRFVVAHETIDRIVLGVDSAAHLRTNVAALGNPFEDSALSAELRQLAVNEEKVVVPSLWT
ncbi:MAG: aldo/keto reductase [Elusimicrobia bacterium]|nr:aldo/keto reductase [Elusimicrobiota bacterium]